MKHAYAVIMAGGSGERFWPKSRRNLPKQLLPILSNKSMLKETIDRLKGFIPIKRTFVVTNKIQAGLAKKESRCKNIIAEPLSKNTAACIAVSANIIQKKDKKAIMVVLPADQAIKDIKRFTTILSNAVVIADTKDVLVTLGMKPTRPHTGFGYIEKGGRITKGVYKVSKFTEKPDLATAKRYLKSGRYLWNGGTFICKAKVMLDEIKKYMPKLYNLCKEESINNIYKKAENISIDYGVMEKTDRAVVIEADFNWDDAGSWASLDRHLKKNKNGNIIKGDVVYKDVHNTTIITDSCLAAGIGLANLVIVCAKDAVLVCSKDRSEDVKHIVGMLKKEKRYKRYL